MSDSLFYTAYTGAEAALVVVTADDPGLFSSQNEQDNRHYAKLGKFPMLEPCDSQECKDFMESKPWTSANASTRPWSSARPCAPRIPSPWWSWAHPWRLRARSVAVPPQHRKVQFHVHVGARSGTTCLSSGLLDHGGLEQRRGRATRIDWGDREYGFVRGGIVYEDPSGQVCPAASILKLGMCYPLPKKLIREFADGVQQRHRGRGA